MRMLLARRPLVTGGLIVVLALGSLCAVFLVSAYGTIRAVQREKQNSFAELQRGDWNAAAKALGRLAVSSDRLLSKLHGPVPRFISAVPLVGRAPRTVEAIAEAVRDVSRAAARAVPALEGQSLGRAGAVNLAAVGPLRDVARTVLPSVNAARGRLRRSSSWPLVPPLGWVRKEALEQLDSASHGLTTAASAADLTAEVLGANQARRYLLLFENPGEMVGSGGFWGSHAILQANQGRLSLGELGRPAIDFAEYTAHRGPAWYEDRYRLYAASSNWRKFGVAPDFPTVAALAEADLQAAPGIGPIDGTIAIDPLGLAAVLRVTGPVRVPSWPVRLTAGNVARVTLHDAYGWFPGVQRHDLLGVAAQAAWSRFLTSDLSVGSLAAAGFGGAIDERHFKFHFVRPAEQRLAELLNADGALNEADRTFGLVTMNTGLNKMDYWLERRVDVDLRLLTRGGAAGSATVTLRNRGASRSDPAELLGGTERFKPGWSYQLLRIYLPSGATLTSSGNGRVAEELGFKVVEWDVVVPPSRTVRRQVSFDLASPHVGRMPLRLRRQGFIRGDEFHIQISGPRGTKVVIAAIEPCAQLRMTKDVVLEARFERWLPSWPFGSWWGTASCGRGG